MKKKNIFDITPLDEEEKEFLEMYESGNMVPVDDQVGEIKKAQAGAKNTLKRVETITVDISMGDRIKLEKKAEADGVSLKEQISKILHQYSSVK